MTDDALPLVATADDTLLDDALRWCAAVGATPEVAPDLTAVRRAWRGATLVVVGDDLLPRLAAADLPRRDHVLVVARDPQSCWPAAVRLGAVGVFSPRVDDTAAVDALAAALDGRGEACLVSVVGGAGGAGASTFATALALASADRGLRTMLVDADPLGPGLDLVLGGEHVEGVRWGDLDAAQGRVSAGSLADVLPRHRGVSTLSWDRTTAPALPASVPAVLAAASRAFDVVVADVPRHLGPFGHEFLGRSVLTVVLVPEDVGAVGATRRVLERVQACASEVAVVSRVRPGGVGAAAVAEALGRPVLARQRHDRQVGLSVDRGHGPGRSRTVRRAARDVLDALGLEAA